MCVCGGGCLRGPSSPFPWASVTGDQSLRVKLKAPREDRTLTNQQDQCLQLRQRCFRSIKDKGADCPLPPCPTDVLPSAPRVTPRKWPESDWAAEVQENWRAGCKGIHPDGVITPKRPSLRHEAGGRPLAGLRSPAQGPGAPHPARSHSLVLEGDKRLVQGRLLKSAKHRKKGREAWSNPGQRCKLPARRGCGRTSHWTQRLGLCPARKGGWGATERRAVLCPRGGRGRPPQAPRLGALRPALLGCTTFLHLQSQQDPSFRGGRLPGEG